MGREHPAPTPEDDRKRRRGAFAWFARHKLLTAGIALLLVGAGAAAGIFLRQDIATTVGAADPDVVFAEGASYPEVSSAGFASMSFGASATSASLSLYSVPGAAAFQITDLMDLANSDATQAYNVSVARSAGLDAAITELTFTFNDAAGDPVTSWDAVASDTSAGFTLPADTTYTMDVSYLLADGTPAGDLGSFDLQVSLTPA
ncbi:MAG: hypothetical protein ACPGQL_04735 [Thermoplasmatota archaeon]